MLINRGWGRAMELLYVAVFAILALNGIVLLLAISHAMNNRD
jgi:hypothetical protein